MRLLAAGDLYGAASGWSREDCRQTRTTHINTNWAAIRRVRPHSENTPEIVSGCIQAHLRASSSWPPASHPGRPGASRSSLVCLCPPGWWGRSFLTVVRSSWAPWRVSCSSGRRRTRVWTCWSWSFWAQLAWRWARRTLETVLDPENSDVRGNSVGPRFVCGGRWDFVLGKISLKETRPTNLWRLQNCKISKFPPQEKESRLLVPVLLLWMLITNHQQRNNSKKFQIILQLLSVNKLWQASVVSGRATRDTCRSKAAVARRWLPGDSQFKDKIRGKYFLSYRPFVLAKQLGEGQWIFIIYIDTHSD